jgi:hypothetical protein
VEQRLKGTVGDEKGKGKMISLRVETDNGDISDEDVGKSALPKEGSVLHRMTADLYPFLGEGSIGGGFHQKSRLRRLFGR